MFSFLKNVFKKSDPEQLSQPSPPIEKTSVSVKYSYEWKENVPISERDTPTNPSRPFCKKLMEVKRLYTRADIEKLSERLGYSVFDNCGGEGCRHRWVSNIVVAKSANSTSSDTTM